MIDRTHLLPGAAAMPAAEAGPLDRLLPPDAGIRDGLALMRRIDELHLHYPFAGARMLRDLLRQEGQAIGGGMWPP
jgi:putative transposase